MFPLESDIFTIVTKPHNLSCFVSVQCSLNVRYTNYLTIVEYYQTSNEIGLCIRLIVLFFKHVSEFKYLSVNCVEHTGMLSTTLCIILHPMPWWKYSPISL